jgi:hypothetical protein
MPSCRDVLVRHIRAYPPPLIGRIEVLSVDDLAI